VLTAPAQQDITMLYQVYKNANSVRSSVLPALMQAIVLPANILRQLEVEVPVLVRMVKI
jgi:hypothetical protein